MLLVLGDTASGGGVASCPLYIKILDQESQLWAMNTCNPHNMIGIVQIYSNKF